MKKLLVSFFVGLVILLSFAPYLSPVKAQTTWYNQSFQDWYGKVYDTKNPSEIFGERYTAAQVQWVIYGLFSFILNSAGNSNVLSCVLSNTANLSTCKDAIQNLLISQTNTNTTYKPDNNLLSHVFATDRPLSGIGYIKNKIDNFSLVPIAHAQTAGFGFNMLQPIQSMWVAIRNFAYALFVIAAIVLSFMIMFRVKLSPQTVISVQSALPKIIIALILVTFSYAIAGFLVDLMYVVIGLISVAATPMVGHFLGMNTLTSTNLFNIMTVGQPWGGTQFGFLGIGVVYTVLFIIFFIVLLFLNLGILVSAGIGVGISALIGVAGPILGTIGIVIGIILVIMILVFFFRVLWTLTKAFVNIILLTIFAPLQIALGVVVPNIGFGAWLKSYISNLATFVVVGTLTLLSIVFLTQGWQIVYMIFSTTQQSGKEPDKYSSGIYQQHLPDTLMFLPSGHHSLDWGTPAPLLDFSSFL